MFNIILHYLKMVLSNHNNEKEAAFILVSAGSLTASSTNLKACSRVIDASVNFVIGEEN